MSTVGEEQAKSRSAFLWQAVILVLFSVVIVSSLFFSGIPRVNEDPGLGWHLRVGERVLQRGHFPRVDPFTLGVHGESRAWIADQWLGDVFLSLVQSFGGFEFLALVSLAVFVLTFWCLPILSFAPSAVSFLALCITGVLTFKLAGVQLVTRPVLFGFLLFVLFFFSLLRCSHIRLMWHGFLMLIWVNTHSSFVFGILLSVLVVLDARSKGELRKSCLATFILFLISLINPYGFGVYDSLLSLGQSNYFQGLHQEWKALELTSGAGSMFLRLSVLALLGAVAVAPRIRNGGLRWLVAASLIFSYLTIESSRVAPYAAIALFPLAVYGFDMLLGALLRLKSLSRAKFLLRGLDQDAWSASKIALCFLPSLILLGLLHAQVATGWTPSRLVSLDEFREVLVSQEARVAAPYDDGGPIIYLCNGKCQPLIDDRNQLYGEAYVRKYLEYWKARNYRGFRDALGATHLLVPNTQTVDNYEALELLQVSAKYSLYRFSML